MRHPLSAELQALLAEYRDAAAQVKYRDQLIEEAQRDLRNKNEDYQIAKYKMEEALKALIEECDE